MREQKRLRQDVQGLRGIAVLAVVLDHAFGWPGGGFLGVDVFFVISGFVITTGLLREHAAAGRIDLPRFALRRVRRLAPASLAVLLVTVAAAWVLVPAARFSTIATDAAWATVALGNWRFAAEGTDYFAASAAVSPLQHFWSLGVEEQFYLVLPVVLVLLLGRGGGSRTTRLGTGRSTVTLMVIGSLVSCSLAWAFLAVQLDPGAAYFSTATRAWELGLGVLVALVLHRWGSVPSWLAEPMAAVGLLAVLGSVTLGDESIGVPAPLALIPTIGTALVIAAGAGPSTWAAAALRWRPLVGLGTVSYSLYLWHWPFIVLLPLFTSVPMWIVLVLALGTSIASYFTIESPFRHGDPRGHVQNHRPQLRLSGLAVLAIVALVTASTAAERLKPLPAAPAVEAAVDEDTDEQEFPALRARADAVTAGLGVRSWPATLTPSAEAISAEDYTVTLMTKSKWAPTLGCARNRADWLADSCVWGAPAGTDVVLAGDSTAAFSAPGWRAVADDPSAGIRLRNGARIGCPFAAVALASAAASCAEHNAEVLAELERTKPQMLVVTNRYWSESDPDMVSITQEQYEAGIRELVESARPHVERVVIVPATPPGLPPTNCVAGTKGPQDCRGGYESVRALIDSLRSTFDGVSGVTVLDSTVLWCAVGACPALIDDTLVRSDAIHVTAEASSASGPALLELLRKQELLPGVGASGP